MGENLLLAFEVAALQNSDVEGIGKLKRVTNKSHKFMCSLCAASDEKQSQQFRL